MVENNMKSNFTKGKANQYSLADRMKNYENVTTCHSLIERLPIYVRIDMRAGHTWCHDLDRPFDKDYSNAMKFATSYMVEKTGAILGFCQSDECSLVYEDNTKLPFETRIFKIQSVFASMFTSAFIQDCVGTKLWNKIESGKLPSFDCRVLNLPNMTECANMILWRSKDSIKNSITLLALEHFSNKQIHGKNGDDKIKMLSELGVDYNALPEENRFGAFFRREVYNKEITESDISANPKIKFPSPDENGKIFVTRSRVIQFELGMSLLDISNREGVLFNSETPERKS